MVVYGVDQSLTGFGHCVLTDGEITQIGTVGVGDKVGMERLEILQTMFETTIAKCRPDLIVIEDYAFGASTNTITQLAELGGILKWTAHKMAYLFGWDRSVAGFKSLVTQTQSQMKKFCLGNGSAKKDSRYLLTVMEKINKSFSNDNEADAYMHAWMATIVHAVKTGKTQVGDLPAFQQEVLISQVVKSKKISITKALKLSDEEKMKLIAA